MNETRITQTDDRVVVDSESMRCVFAIDKDGTAAACQLANVISECEALRSRVAELEAENKELAFKLDLMESRAWTFESHIKVLEKYMGENREG